MNCMDLSFSLKLFICFWKKYLTVPPKKDSFLYIKHTKCDMEYRTKHKVFKKFKMSSKERISLGDYLWKIISIKKIYQFFIYTVFIFITSKVVKKIPLYGSHFQTLRGEEVPDPTFKLWRRSRVPGSIVLISRVLLSHHADSII